MTADYLFFGGLAFVFVLMLVRWVLDCFSDTDCDQHDVEI